MTVFSALFMAPTACESGSQEVEVSDARGSKNRSSGGQISPPPRVKFRSPGIPDGLLEPSWGVVGARSASGGRSGWERGRWKVVLRALGTVLEPFWRVLGPLLVDFPTRGEGPGRLPEVIFEAFFGRPGREAKKRQFSTYVDVYFVHFSLLCFVPCCLPCCMAGGAAQMQKCSKSIGFVGRKPYASFFRQRPKQSNFRGHA